MVLITYEANDQLINIFSPYLISFTSTEKLKRICFRKFVNSRLKLSK